MKNVVLATGNPELDNEMRKNISSVSFVDSATHQEAIVDSLGHHKPDIVVVSDKNDDAASMKDFVLKIRTRFPEIQLVYIAKDNTPQQESFLRHWMVSNVLFDSANFSEIEKAFHI